MGVMVMRRRIGPALVSLLCGVAVLLPATGAEADPGGPVISSECRPAAAIVRARLATV